MAPVRVSRSCMLLLGLVVALCMLALPAVAALDSEEQAVVNLINTYRQQNGLNPLQISTTLDAAAEWMSTDMATKNYFSHTDSLGRDPFQRMAAFGYGYNAYKGENIAAGYGTASQTFAQWRNSAGHNQNMLNPNYKVMGIARVYNAASTYKWYWTNDFGGYVDSTATTPPPAPGNTLAIPTPPINLKASTQSQPLTVKWQAGSGGGPAATYEVLVSRAYSTYSATYTVTAPTTSCVITVPMSATYNVRVRARNDAGVSSYSTTLRTYLRRSL